MNAVWLPIADNIGLYSISDQGEIYSEHNNVILKPQPNSKGYLRVWLSNRQQVFVHHLVMYTFEGPRPDGLWILHRDDDHSHNAWSNLYYGTPSENMTDMIANGNNANLNKTHCIEGHAFTPENTLPNGLRGRGCRECARRRSRDYMRTKYKARQLNTATTHH